MAKCRYGKYGTFMFGLDMGNLAGLGLAKVQPMTGLNTPDISLKMHQKDI